MPRWGKSALSAEEMQALERRLQASLVPLEADTAFVEHVHHQLAARRPVDVSQAASWNEAWLLLGGLSGTLLLLGALTIFLFFRHRKGK